ncbi:MAG: ribonuclease E [Acidobacteriia bacterium]|nr:ribonuclease E [Terriglobia bacterium]
MSTEPVKSVQSANNEPPKKSWWKRRRRWHKTIIRLLVFAIVLVILNSTLSRLYDYWDVGSGSWFSRFSGNQWNLQRGAAIVNHPNQFGDQYSSVRYLWQGWSPADSLWFYTTTQGSDLLPYDFFMELQDPATGKLFRSEESLYSYGYLLQTATRHNPDALPVGFAKDTYMGKDYLGFTCAACHTAQVNYKGVAMRIDGGPAGSDLDSMLQKLSDVMQSTLADKAALEAFEKRVIDRGGNYSSTKAVDDDLKNFSQRLTTYEFINRSPTRYGYFRLDAFGRIYNRVLEHIITQDQLNGAMEDLVKDGAFTQKELDALRQDQKTSILTGKQRDHLVFRLAQLLPLRAQVELKKKIFNEPNAPVSYPYLWDVPQHDYVQWNGIVPNAGLGPIGRNAGEVIGVFATLDWSQQPGISLASVISGQGFSGPHIDYKSSINVHNLRRIEHHLNSLQSPKWPGDILPAIDQSRVHKGELLFSKHCAVCHTNIDSTSPKRRVVAQMTSLKNVRTDPRMARNSVVYDGLSGILLNQYTSSGAGPVLIDQRAPVAALLTKATLSVVATPSPNKNFIRRGLDWADDLITSFLDNDIKPSIKRGNYDPDTTAEPYASLLSYKARALNGIWATAPYLHNGSVPTLYDLLLPQNPEDAKDPIKAAPCVPNPDYRPCKFMVGSREFDPEKVGLKSSGYDGFSFNVRLPGNGNGGHEYGTKVLSKEDRLDLLEYLKTL